MSYISGRFYAEPILYFFMEPRFLHYPDCNRCFMFLLYFMLNGGISLHIPLMAVEDWDGVFCMLMMMMVVVMII